MIIAIDAAGIVSLAHPGADLAVIPKSAGGIALTAVELDEAQSAAYEALPEHMRSLRFVDGAFVVEPLSYADRRRAEYNRRGATMEVLIVAVVEHLAGHSEDLLALAAIRDSVKADIPKDAKS